MASAIKYKCHKQSCSFEWTGADMIDHEVQIRVGRIVETHRITSTDVKCPKCQGWVKGLIKLNFQNGKWGK